MENPAIISAIIAAVVSLIGLFVSYKVSKSNLKSRLHELRLKSQELDSAQKNFIEEIRIKGKELELGQENLMREFEELKQAQMTNILEKRIEAYPKLWSIHIRYETNWSYEKKKKDKLWALNYVDELNAYNVDNGIFFSQNLYEKFFDLRSELYLAIESADPITNEIPPNYIDNIRSIVYGGHGKPGLSTIEKDDLGSYYNVAIARRK